MRRSTTFFIAACLSACGGRTTLGTPPGNGSGGAAGMTGSGGSAANGGFSGGGFGGSGGFAAGGTGGFGAGGSGGFGAGGSGGFGAGGSGGFGAGGTGGGFGGAGGGPMCPPPPPLGNPQCSMCVGSACCGPLQVCVADPTCMKETTCIANCVGAPPPGVDLQQILMKCASACAADPSGVINPATNQMIGCMNGACTPPCFEGGMGGSGGSGGSGGACTSTIPPGTTCNAVTTGSQNCDACLQAKCCDTVDKCFNTPDCAGVIECIGQNCPNAQDVNACVQQFCSQCAGGVSMLNDIDTCLAQQCAGQCQ